MTHAGVQPALLSYACLAHVPGCALVSPCCQTLPTLLRELAPAQQQALPSLTHLQILGPGCCRGSGGPAPAGLGSSSQPPARVLRPGPAFSQAVHRERNDTALLLAASTWGAAMCCAAITQAIRRCQLGFVVIGEQTRPRSSPRALGLLLGQSSALPTYLGSPLHPSGAPLLEPATLAMFLG